MLIVEPALEERADSVSERPVVNAALRRLWYLKQEFRLRRDLRRGFIFEGRHYPFLVAYYNRTWINERQVEIPLALDALRHAPGPRVLEVGNVLSNYRRIRHIVVDKYEQAPGVRNEDFVDHAGGPYDLLVSISTFEHIGWDEPQRDPAKFRRAMGHAVSLLAPGGRLFVTVPLGYNPSADAFVRAPPPGFRVAFMRRTGPGPGQWEEATDLEPADYPFGVGCAFAAAVAIIRVRG